MQQASSKGLHAQGSTSSCVLLDGIGLGTPLILRVYRTSLGVHLPCLRLSAWALCESTHLRPPGPVLSPARRAAQATGIASWSWPQRAARCSALAHSFCLAAASHHGSCWSICCVTSPQHAATMPANLLVGLLLQSFLTAPISTFSSVALALPRE